MAYITKRGSSYGVRYTYQDEQGKNCNKWESFSTKEEAINRKKQIEHELANGTFLIPSTVTVAEFLMDWLPKQCNKHKWAPCTYQSNLGTVQNLIIPYIGDMQMQKLKPYHLEDLYATLGKMPCGQYYEGKKQVLSEKQQQRLLSGTTIHEVHRLLRTAFQYAVEWGILIKSPVPVDSPKKSIQERAIWDADEMWAALASMEDPILHLAVHLTLVGALREGEVAGLTPEDLDFEGADGTGTFRINKCMQRVQKASLAKTGKGCILQEFAFCADFHPSQSRRTGEILLLRRQRGRIGRCARVGEPRRGWQRVEGGHFHTQTRQTGRSGTLPPPHRQVRPVIRDLLTPISLIDGGFGSLTHAISLMDGGSNSKNEVWGYESYPQTSDLLQYTAIHKRDTSRRT